MDKTVPLCVRIPKTLRTNIQQEADYNKANHNGSPLPSSFSAVVVARLSKERMKQPLKVFKKERTVLRCMTIPMSIMEEMKKEIEANKEARNQGHRYVSALLIERLMYAPLFIKPRV
jgi:hypothetical protein